MKIELSAEQLMSLIEHLGALSISYKLEAAAYASIKRKGLELAEERLEAAREVNDLQDYLLTK